MSKVNITKINEDQYYLEVCNDVSSFLTIKIKLTKDELANLNSIILDQLS